MITSESLFNRWLALDVASFPTSTFYFMLPLIVVLPYGYIDSIFNDGRNNPSIAKFTASGIIVTSAADKKFAAYFDKK